MITANRISKVEGTRSTYQMITNMWFNVNFDDVKTNADNVDIDYTFTANYEDAEKKPVGVLKVSGSLSAKESKDLIKEIKSVWDSKKSLPLKFAEDVLFLINLECGSRGTLVAYSMGFVAPLPITRPKLEEKATGEAAA